MANSANQMTSSIRELSQLQDQHGIRPNRKLGQHFVVDPPTIWRIVELSGAKEGDRIVEIGGGLGALTLALAKTGAHVTTIELDKKLALALAKLVEGHGVIVMNADACKLDWLKVTGGEPGWKLVANLPYNIATTLIIDLLRKVEAIESMLVMVQREVGERLTASAGSRNVGIPTWLVAYYGEARIVGRVPPSVFYPAPKVESTLVKIKRHESCPVAQPLEDLEPLIKAGFGNRRKMLRRSLAHLIDADGFSAAGIDSRARPETLTLYQWSALAALAQPV